MSSQLTHAAINGTMEGGSGLIRIEQVARQAAAQQALLCAEHLTSCALHRPDLCEPIVVTLPNATTARDLSPSRPARRALTETSPVTTFAGYNAFK